MVPKKTCRGSHHRCSVKKVVLENFGKFIGKRLCKNLIFNTYPLIFKTVYVTKPVAWAHSTLAFKRNVHIDFISLLGYQTICPIMLLENSLTQTCELEISKSWWLRIFLLKKHRDHGRNRETWKFKKMFCTCSISILVNSRVLSTLLIYLMLTSGIDSFLLKN